MKQVVAALMLAAISIALAVGALEGALQIREARRLYREAHRRFHPFLQVVPSAENLDHINAAGFRGDSIGETKPSATFRVFVLGGSTTLGVANRYADTYPAKLQTLLRTRFPSLRIEVQNAGVDWYTTAHSLINYQLRVRRYQPDVVIVFQAINDLYRSFSPPWWASGPYRSDYSHYLGPQIRFFGPQVGFLDGSAEPALTDMLLWRQLKQVVLREPSPYITTPDNVQRLKARLQPETVTTFKSLDAFRRNYELLIRSVQADGAALVMASEPFLYKGALSVDEERSLYFGPVFCAEAGRYPTIDSLRGGMEQFNGAARSLAKVHGVPFLEFERAVPKTGRYFSDDVHLRADGNAILAGAAFDWIVAHQPFERRP